MATEQVKRHPIKLGFWFILILVGILFFGWTTRSVYLSSKPEPLSQARDEERIQNLRELQKSAQTTLTTYDWVDEQKGIVRIPIDRAMELVSEEWQDPDAAREKLIQRVEKVTAKPEKPEKPKASQFE